MTGWRTTVVLIGLWLLVGCTREELALPSEDAIVEAFQSERPLSGEVTGNVAVLYVEQSFQQLRRGGNLWAKVGPYIFLFSAEAQRLFDGYPGLVGIRVETRVGDATVASAVLMRDELSDLQWRRSLNIAGLARGDGTNRMTLLEDLVRWGEDHTLYEYNERYTRR
ncbi:MAG: hypothetical protein P8L45_02125 [Longimicrobiales bacterium]|nr:hypothetical protein [Longimicrobiales bacterium]